MFNHLKKVCLDYVSHMLLSLSFSCILMKGSILAFCHAFIPDIFVTSTSDLVEYIFYELRQHGCDKENEVPEENVKKVMVDKEMNTENKDDSKKLN